MSDVNSKIIYSAGGVDSLAYELGDGDYTVAVVGQNHGDEVGGREAFEEIFEDLPEEFDDISLSFIPEANAFASTEVERKTPLEFQPNRADEHDLNRSYNTAREELGSDSVAGLNLTRQAALHVLEYLEQLDPDLVIDMHSGTSGTVKMPQVRYKHRDDFPVEEDRLRGFTENAGVEMFSMEPDRDAEMLGAVAPWMGYPAVTVEVGGGVEHCRKGSFEDSDLEQYQEIIRNILNYAVEDAEIDFNPREFSSIEKYHTPMDVEGEVEYHFELGDEILEGETVATVSGDEKHEIVAEDDGALETVLAKDLRDDVGGGNRVFNIATRD
jgi:predicted deacylase